MSDYIKREDVIAVIYDQHVGGKEACENARPNTYGADLREIVSDIEDIPAANVVERELYERALSDVIKHRKGKWVRKELQTKEFGRLLVVECSKCKKNQMCKSKYRPNCGAEMEMSDV